jgi:hypothetical protein
LGSDSGSDIDFLPYSSSDSNIELDKDQFLSTPNNRKKEISTNSALKTV